MFAEWRETEQTACSPRLNRAWERFLTLPGRRIYHRLMISIISTGAVTVNIGESHFVLKESGRHRRSRNELGCVSKVLCLTMVLEAPLKLSTKNTASEDRTLKQTFEAAATNFVATAALGLCCSAHVYSCHA